MAIIHCPECGKEVSNTAVACPNCGHPLAPPNVERKTIIREAPPVVEKEGFPNWIFIPLAVLGIVVIFLLIVLFQNKDETDRTNVNITTDRTADVSTTTVRTDEPKTEVVVPSNPSSDVDLPPSTTTTIPSTGGTTTIDDATNVGTINLELKTRDKTGNVQPAKNEIFYLLDKDLESILSEANITPISGQTLTNSFGLSVVYPDRYNDVRKKALDAIEKHIKYDVKTDTSGKAKMGKVKPDSYYFFAIHKTPSGFALWNSPITINNGENNLNIQPQNSVEIK
ncbi:MAG TPA: zinc-ribbon domain-containing protein [Pyrinomonadaceae bacterium]|nr:zinc-ribbon domain-containing protein [Pyrinomonadaceae bacterium]